MSHGKSSRYISGVYVGKKIMVYYNRKKPNQSVLLKGINFGNYLEIISLVVFLVFLSNGLENHREMITPKSTQWLTL